MDQARTPPVESLPVGEAADVGTPALPVVETHGRRIAVTRFGMQTFSALRHRDYRYLWVGTMFMSAGQWIQQVTLGWLLYDMTGSSILLGVLNGLRSLPFLVSGPIAGVAADRMDRRRLLLSSQVLLLITACVMGSLVVSGLVQVWHLFVFTLITGVAWSFNQPLRQTLVPSVVPKSDLMNAIALSSLGFNMTKVLAPSLGGLLIAWFGAGGNFFVQSATYAGVLAMVYMMRVPPGAAPATQQSMFSSMREGLSYVWSHPVVMALLGSSLVMQIFAMPYQTLMPVFQKDVLGTGPEGLGMMMAAPAGGAVLATVLLASVANIVRRKGLLTMGGLFLMGCALIAFSQARSLPLAMLALVGVGSCQMLVMVTTMSMVQSIVPDELRGRVMSIAMLDRGLTPLGALMAGIMTSFIGAPVTVSLMGALVILLAVLVIWRLPRIREFRT
jgi:MFS transporter, DHA1 family, staphyloferrin A biosynthesis exporter